MYFKGKRNYISKMRTSVLCQSFLPANDRNLQCSCQNPQHSTEWEGTCTSLWQTCCLETCVQRITQQGSVLGLRREGFLQQDSEFLWKGMSTNHAQTRSNSPLAHWPEGKGLATPLLEEDWDINDLCTATLCEENEHLQAAV